MIAYQLLAPWRSSVTGWHLMSFMASIAAVLDLTVIRIFAGDTGWLEWARLGVFTAVPVVLTWRLALIIGTQAEPPAGRRADGEDADAPR